MTEEGQVKSPAAPGSLLQLQPAWEKQNVRTSQVDLAMQNT